MSTTGSCRALLAPSCALLGLLAVPAFADEIQAPVLKLAAELSKAGDHHGAAIEFRRLALGTSAASERGAYDWAAAYEYWRGKELEAADQMLSRTESEAPEWRPAVLLLRTESELAKREWKTAALCAQKLLNSATTNQLQVLAARKLAAAQVREQDVAAARDALAQSPVNLDKATAALDQYAAGHDKSPTVGGLLGLIPGFGYFYSGQYGDGFRSLLLNGLFIYGMVDTGRKNEWGAFGAITFFESVWYSGSVYGGIDAAQRYNRQRLDSAVNSINGDAGFEPDYRQLPLVVLKFEF